MMGIERFVSCITIGARQPKSCQETVIIIILVLEHLRPVASSGKIPKEWQVQFYGASVTCVRWSCQRGPEGG
jgi:hypothetical protein